MIAVPNRRIRHHTITIADHGPGIADDDKPRALTRFWRADTSTPGTGIGLSNEQRGVR